MQAHKLQQYHVIVLFDIPLNILISFVSAFICAVSVESERNSHQFEAGLVYVYRGYMIFIMFNKPVKC